MLAFLFLIFGLIAGVVNAADVSSNLLAYWPLDKDVKDVVGGHDGNLVGGAEFVKDAKRGAVLQVDGINGHAVVPHAADIVFAAKDSYTLSVWLNVLTAPGHWAGIVNKSRDISPWYGLWIDTTNRWVAGGTNITGSVIQTNVWIHLALIQDGPGNKRLVYVDGAVNIQGTAIDSTGSGELWMGGAKNVTEFLHGLIDDAALFKRVLTPDDIKALASGTKIMGVAVESRDKMAITWGDIRQ